MVEECKHGLTKNTCAYCTKLIKKATFRYRERGQRNDGNNPREQLFSSMVNGARWVKLSELKGMGDDNG